MVDLRDRLNRLDLSGLHKKRVLAVQKYRNFYRNLLNGGAHKPDDECDPMYLFLQGMRGWNDLRDLLNKIADKIRQIEDEIRRSGRGPGRH